VACLASARKRSLLAPRVCRTFDHPVFLLSNQAPHSLNLHGTVKMHTRKAGSLVSLAQESSTCFCGFDWKMCSPHTKRVIYENCCFWDHQQSITGAPICLTLCLPSPYDAARVVWTLLAPKEGGAKLKRECCGVIWPPSTPGGPKTAHGLLTPFNSFFLSNYCTQTPRLRPALDP
jgi:hypothetical protein